ncbi:MAG TPA: hypothetical protein ENK37_04505 [Oceanithermus profundus]|uniref:DUF4388 domain-containing protein n=1 Tax=Oceanithermus profundus TaxID=187137 RepID=A0A7C4VKA2_9DEIN|nr:hypothetical protein [Oceanithermus profundus]
MELSGNLKELDFGQLINLIAHLEGVLELWNLPRRRTAQLYIKRKKLRCVRMNGVFLDPLQAKALIAELAGGSQAAFEFTAKPFRTPCNPPLNWPLDKMLLTLFTQYDERQRYIDRLPDPDRRFRLTVFANPDSSLFLRAASPLLQRQEGASAREIAHELRLPLDQVRYYLHKLQGRDKVEPAE